MKVIQSSILAGLFAVSQAYVVNMYDNTDCSGNPTSRNVWDNTCAYTQGFQSFEVTTYGGNLQQLIAYSPQACAGEQTFKGCAAGVDALVLNKCYATDGGSNALSSYSEGGDCPN